jgi:hypothetical protein
VVAESVQPECGLRVSNLRREVSKPRLVGTSGVVAYPGDIESSVPELGRGAQAHVEVAPCGATLVTEKMRAWASETEGAQMALFAEARMSGKPVGCPRLVPRIWMATIA